MQIGGNFEMQFPEKFACNLVAAYMQICTAAATGKAAQAAQDGGDASGQDKADQTPMRHGAWTSWRTSWPMAPSFEH
jgi:hypothetical protein